MFEFVHTRIAWLASVFLIWSTYGALQAEPEAQASKKVTQVEIHDELVAIRDALAIQLKVRDPFRFPQADGRGIADGPAPGAGLVGVVDTAVHWGATYGPVLVDYGAPLMPALHAWKLLRGYADEFEAAQLAPEELGPEPSFSLKLEAVSRSNGVSLVRINGRLFREGDVIPTSDKLFPPRVQAIEGVTVYVMHRGGVLTLDLDNHPTLQVGQPVEVAVTAQSSASSPSGRALTPRERSRLNKQAGAKQ